MARSFGCDQMMANDDGEHNNPQIIISPTNHARQPLAAPSAAAYGSPAQAAGPTGTLGALAARYYDRQCPMRSLNAALPFVQGETSRIVFESFDGRKRDNESGVRGLHPHIRVPWSPHDVYDLGQTRGDLVGLRSCTSANPSPTCPQNPRVCSGAILTEKETT